MSVGIFEMCPLVCAVDRVWFIQKGDVFRAKAHISITYAIYRENDFCHSSQLVR